MENFLAKIEGKKKRQENLLRDMARLQKTVAKHFKIPIADLTAKKRPGDLVHQRQIAFFIAKEHLHYYFREIGECFQRDPTTVIYAYYKLKKQIDEDHALRETISEIADKLTPRLVSDTVMHGEKPSDEKTA